MPTEMNELHRDLGALSTQVRVLNETLNKVEGKLERLEERLGKMDSSFNAAMNQARGGWKTLAALAGLAGGIAGFASTFAKLKLFG